MAYIGKNIFINNKYKKWHDSIIAKAKHRTLEGYKEVHHIIPKSCGGTNDKDNLVPLKAREHYIIHMLLPYFTTGQIKHKMLNAFIFMTAKSKACKRDYKINLRVYEKLKSEFSKSLKGRRLTAEWKAKISKTLTGTKLPESVKRKISLGNMGKKVSEKNKLAFSIRNMGNKYNLGKKVSLETRKKLSIINTGKKHTEETKAKIKYARQFQVCSDEQRKNYSKIYSNLIWVNKDNKSKRVNKELKKDYLSNGYKLGRDMSYMTDELKNIFKEKTTAYWQRKVA
jgi:hypothetical protein